MKNNKLFNSNFLLFWQGQVISLVGSQIYYMAMILWITDATDSASLLGLMGLVAGIPTIFLSAIGGTVADLFSRKTILIICDVVNAIIVFALAYMFYTSENDISMLVSIIMGIAFMSSVVTSFFTPAASAAIPDLVPKDKLTAANSFRQSAAQIATLLGWTLSSFLYVSLGILALVLINAVTFVVAAITKYFITIPQKKIEHKDGINKKIIYADLKEGLKYVWARAGLRKTVIVSLFQNFFAIPITILLPFYIKDHLHLASRWLPIFMSFSMVGSVIGLIFAGTLKLSPNKRKNIMIIGIMINASLTILLGFNKETILAILILILTGAIAGFIQVHIQTIMQASTAQEIRGRVFGFISTITSALIPLGMGLSGFIGDLTNKNFPLIYGFSGGVLVILSIYMFFSNDIKDFLSFEINVDEDESESKETI